MGHQPGSGADPAGEKPAVPRLLVGDVADPRLGLIIDQHPVSTDDGPPQHTIAHFPLLERICEDYNRNNNEQQGQQQDHRSQRQQPTAVATNNFQPRPCDCRFCYHRTITARRSCRSISIKAAGPKCSLHPETRAGCGGFTTSTLVASDGNLQLASRYRREELRDGDTEVSAPFHLQLVDGLTPAASAAHNDNVSNHHGMCCSDCNHVQRNSNDSANSYNNNNPDSGCANGTRGQAIDLTIHDSDNGDLTPNVSDLHGAEECDFKQGVVQNDGDKENGPEVFSCSVPWEQPTRQTCYGPPFSPPPRLQRQPRRQSTYCNDVAGQNSDMVHRETGPCPCVSPMKQPVEQPLQRSGCSQPPRLQEQPLLQRPHHPGVLHMLNMAKFTKYPWGLRYSLQSSQL